MLSLREFMFACVYLAPHAAAEHQRASTVASSLERPAYRYFENVKEQGLS